MENLITCTNQETQTPEVEDVIMEQIGSDRDVPVEFYLSDDNKVAKTPITSNGKHKNNKKFRSGDKR